MQLFGTFILVSVQALLCDATNVDTTKSPTVPVQGLPENADLISINDLKENLRKNNDDYIDKAVSISSIASTIAKVTNNQSLSTTPRPANRRAYDMNKTVTYKISTKKRGPKMKLKDLLFPSRYPKYVNKEKPDKQVVKYRADEQGDKADQKVKETDLKDGKADQQVDKADQQVDKADQQINKADQQVDKADPHVIKAKVEKLKKLNYEAHQQIDKADQLVEKADPHVNKAKVEKLKKFLDKYKGLVQDFISSKDAAAEENGEGRTEPMPSAAADPGAGAFRSHVGAEVKDKGEAALRSNDLRAQLPSRARLTTLEVRLPNALELDMAPAVGGKMHALRASHQLCYRNVMIPEGPKYDSKGVVYLGKFKRLRGNEYPSTRPATLELPKCCNCCRKSVLGCD